MLNKTIRHHSASKPLNPTNSAFSFDHRCHRDALDLAHCLRPRKMRKTGLWFMKDTMKLWIASGSEVLRTHGDIPISVGYNFTPPCLFRAYLHVDCVCCLISRFLFLGNNYNLKSAQMNNTSNHSIQSSDHLGILTKVTKEILQPGPGLHQANECGQTTWYTTCAVIVACGFPAWYVKCFGETDRAS
jgi:hypothetical protein